MTKVARVVLGCMSITLCLFAGDLTKKSVGATGAELRLTAQSMNVWLPRMAKTTQFMSSIGTDLIIMAFVPPRQLASTKASLSLPVGLV